MEQIWIKLSSTSFLPILPCLLIWKQARQPLVQLLAQLCVDVGLLSQEAPQEQGWTEQHDGDHFPPGPLVLASHGSVNLPGSVTGLTGGELDGLIFYCLFICGGPGLGRHQRAQNHRPHTVHKTESSVFNEWELELRNDMLRTSLQNYFKLKMR